MLPDLLRTRLVEAIVTLERTGYLSIWHRQAIYAALGPPQPLVPIDLASVSPVERQTLEKEQRDRGGIPVFRSQKVFGADRTPGHVRRTALAIQAVEYVLPVWDAGWYPLGRRTREDVYSIMEIVRQVYAGQQPETQAVAGLFISVGDAHTSADAVHLAALQAYYVAVWDSELQLYPLPPFRSDEELYAFRHDVAGLVAIAAEAQATAFWAWWLTSAVPAAWLAHPDEH